MRGLSNRIATGVSTVALFLVAATGVVSCSSGDGGATESVPSGAVTPAAEADGSASTTPDQPSPTESAAPTAQPTNPPNTPTPEPTFPSAAEQLGLAPIEQLTALSGGGSRPVLEWSSVPGAERYHVFVLSPSGVVYWGWETVDTSVPVGGLPLLNADASGPAVIDGMTWSVSAVDATGHVIALSSHRPVAP